MVGNMKYLSLLLILFVGCIGSPTPRNPMKSKVERPEAWWRNSTIGVKYQDNPWNKFIPKATKSEQTPETVSFPQDWKARKHLTLDETQKLENLKLHIENKKLKRVLQDQVFEKLKMLERERLRKARRKKRAI